jgi:hypothetical protein
MRAVILAFGLAALSFPASAFAQNGTLLIQKQGLFPTFVWVDGQPIGKVTKKKPVSLNLSPGLHEVWYAGDDQAVVTLCHGLVNVQNGGTATTLYRDRGCDGLSPGWPRGRSAFKGSEVAFQIDDAVDAWVSIDGGPAMAFPNMPFMLNLAPGTHTFVLYNDVHQTSVFDQGTVTLRPGERLPLTCTVAGCVGFNIAPVLITELREIVSEIQLAIPNISLQQTFGPGGISVDVRVDDGTGGTVGTSMQVGPGGVDVKVEERR